MKTQEKTKIKQVIMSDDYLLVYKHPQMIEIAPCYALALEETTYGDSVSTAIVGMALLDGYFDLASECDHYWGIVHKTRLEMVRDMFDVPEDFPVKRDTEISMEERESSWRMRAEKQIQSEKERESRKAEQAARFKPASQARYVSQAVVERNHT